jgi:DNA-binding LacI/PurR family transcriptional regulator
MTGPGKRLPDGAQPLTLTELAERAGVSTATVSKVINGRSEVAAETRALIEGLIREHGFRRQRQKVGPARLIELVFHELAGGYPIEVIKGAAHVARRHHLALTVTELQNHLTPGREWVEDVLTRRPMGVITVFSGLTDVQYEQLAARQIPLVVLDPAGDPARGAPSVGAANWSGGFTATRHLLGLGHRRIAVITGPPTTLSSRARVDGYRAALDAAGVAVDADLICPGAFNIKDGLTHTLQLMTIPRPPTAIFACNDGMATGVYTAASELGLNIPTDLSVIGFDDLPAMHWAIPPLTTIRQPLAEMGRVAAEMVMSLAAGVPLRQNRVELGTDLIVRGSTASPVRTG